MSDAGVQYWQQFGQWQEQQTGMAASMRTHSNKDTNMNIKDLSKSKYLKTADIPNPVVVTIDAVEMANVAKEGERKDERPIVTFLEFEKAMVFNATNLKRAAKAIGSDETEDWSGHQLVLYTDEDVEYGGEVVGGLRVRARQKVQREPEERKPTNGVRTTGKPANSLDRQPRQPDPDPRYRDEPDIDIQA